MSKSEENTNELESYGVWVKDTSQTPEDITNKNENESAADTESLDIPEFDDSDFSDMFKNDSDFDSEKLSDSTQTLTDDNSSLTENELADIADTETVAEADESNLFANGEELSNDEGTDEVLLHEFPEDENIKTEEPAENQEDGEKEISTEDIYEQASEEIFGDLNIETPANTENDNFAENGVESLDTAKADSEDIEIKTEDGNSDIEFEEISFDSIDEPAAETKTEESAKTTLAPGEEEISLDDFLEDGFSDDSVASGNNGYEPGKEPGAAQTAEKPLSSGDSEEISLDDFIDTSDFGVEVQESPAAQADDITDEPPLEMDLSFDDSADTIQTEDNKIDTDFSDFTADDTEEVEESEDSSSDSEEVYVADSSNISTEEVDLSDFGIDSDAEETPVTQNVEEKKAADAVVDYDLAIGDEDSLSSAPVINEIVTAEENSQENQPKEEAPAPQAAAAAPDPATTSILQQIMAELTGLKNDINRLKGEIDEVKSSPFTTAPLNAGAVHSESSEEKPAAENGIPEVTEDQSSTGFFDDDGDDTIALSADELTQIPIDNEINDVESESPAEESTGFFTDDGDDTIALSGDELSNIMNTTQLTEEEASAEADSNTSDESSFDLPSSDDIAANLEEEPVFEETSVDEPVFEEAADESSEEAVIEESFDEPAADQIAESPADETVFEDAGFEQPAAEETFAEAPAEEEVTSEESAFDLPSSDDIAANLEEEPFFEETSVEEPVFEEAADESSEEAVIEESFDEPAADQITESPADETVFEDTSFEQPAAEETFAEAPSEEEVTSKESAFDLPSSDDIAENLEEEPVFEETSVDEPVFEEAADESSEEAVIEENFEQPSADQITESPADETVFADTSFEQPAAEETFAEAPAEEEITSEESSFDLPSSDDIAANLEEEPVFEETSVEEPVFEEAADESSEETVVEENFEQPAADQITESPADETVFDEAPLSETATEESSLNEDLPEHDSDLTFNFDDNNLEEPDLENIKFDEIEDSDLPEEISIPKDESQDQTESILVESNTSDFMESVNEGEVTPQTVEEAPSEIAETGETNKEAAPLAAEESPAPSDADTSFNFDTPDTIFDEYFATAESLCDELDSLVSDSPAPAGEAAEAADTEKTSEGFMSVDELTEDKEEEEIPAASQPVTEEAEKPADTFASVDMLSSESEEAPEENEVPTVDKVLSQQPAEIIDSDFAEVDNLDSNISDDNISYLTSDKHASEFAAKDNDANSDLKRDIKSVLLYMDQLLENLPEEKIMEFAKSDEFVTYKKLFTELGLS